MVRGINSFAAAVKSLWSGVCTVTVRKNETNEANGRTEAKEVDLCTNELGGKNKVIKTAKRESLFEAIDIAEFWLEDAIENG